jgi:hypothetical protein
VFEVTMMPISTLIFVAAPVLFFLELLFSQLIIRPDPCHLGSFGAMHDGVCAWISQAWEGLRVCWDIIALAVSRIGLLVFGTRELDVELLMVEGEGNQHGGNVPLALTVGGETSQASQPPPPCDVSVHYMDCAAILIVNLA